MLWMVELIKLVWWKVWVICILVGNVGFRDLIIVFIVLVIVGVFILGCLLIIMTIVGWLLKFLFFCFRVLLVLILVMFFNRIGLLFIIFIIDCCRFLMDCIWFRFCINSFWLLLIKKFFGVLEFVFVLVWVILLREILRVCSLVGLIKICFWCLFFL